MTINDIPRTACYEGYYWMSNASEPVMLKQDMLPENFPGDCNPFVVEAELYDEENRVSYSVHNAGNVVVCNRYEVKPLDFDSADVEKRSFLSNRMPDVQYLSFLEYWEEDEDKAKVCLGMPSLRMSKRVFVGFDKF